MDYRIDLKQQEAWRDEQLDEYLEDKHYCDNCGAEVSDDGYSIDDKACYYCKAD